MLFVYTMGNVVGGESAGERVLKPNLESELFVRCYGWMSSEALALTSDSMTRPGLLTALDHNCIACQTHLTSNSPLLTCKYGRQFSPGIITMGAFDLGIHSDLPTPSRSCWSLKNGASPYCPTQEFQRVDCVSLAYQHLRSLFPFSPPPSLSLLSSVLPRPLSLSPFPLLLSGWQSGGHASSPPVARLHPTWG
jgi:hypothetical protein